MVIHSVIVNFKRFSSVLQRCPLVKRCVINFSFYHSLFTIKMLPTSEIHLRIKSDSNQFVMHFLYHAEELRARKELHFQRSLLEPVDVLINRISLKVNGVNKKKKKLKEKGLTPTEDLTQVSVEFLEDGVPVSGNLICKDLFCVKKNKEITLKIGSQHFLVLINYPWVQKLCLPKYIMAGFMVYPSKFEGYFMKESESEFLWFRKKLESNINSEKQIALGFIYVPTVDDIGSYLKLMCTPVRDGIKGIPVEIHSTSRVEAGPGYCPFESRHVFTKYPLTGDSFRVVSYNILADLYASSASGKQELFSYCESYALNIDYRKLLLFKELVGYNADLICLQEVDCRLFQNDLKAVLRNCGMDGILTKKGGQVSEGVACFYKKSRFKLLSNHSLILGQDCCNELYLKPIWEVVTNNKSLDSKLKERTTAVQVLVFDYLDKLKHRVVVANTHLYFHPDADHIRLIQAGMCLNFINNIMNVLKLEEPDCNVSIVFSGDFNSTPECGVYKLFTSNHVPEDYPEWKCGEILSVFINNLSDNETVVGLSLNNPFNFASACGTPDFTNYTIEFKGCLDYIFYQTDFLKTEQVLPFPSEEEVSRFGAIPSVIFPSDHIALVTDLSWK